MPPETAKPTPVMDVVPPPAAASESLPAPDQANANTDSAVEQPGSEQQRTKVPKPAKKPNSSVTAAIVATVIIVLGLGILAVVAFLKQ